MFDKRLFQLAPGIGRLVAGKIACLWVALLANIGFMIALVALLGNAIAPGLAGSAPMVGDLIFYLAMIAVCAIIRFWMTTLAARLGTEASERVKLALREKLYRKMLALGPSYRTRVKTADIVQSAGEGIEQIQTFFELFLPQLFYAVIAPITLFLVIAPINLPTSLTLLICAPLIVVIVGMVAMSAARVFKKYWGRYTDMGAAFLDDLQGLETLKAFDADERAAREMDEKAENFRVMTMRVLQIQLRSLSAMDIVAYGGTAAGIGMALWQYASGLGSGAGAAGAAAGVSLVSWAGSLPGPLAYVGYALSYVFPFTIGGPITLSGLLFIALLSADFFIPLRQLGSYFHVAMNGMTSTKRIFALLDAPEPPRGDESLPADATDLTVRFDRVGFSYDAGDSSGASDSPSPSPAPALRDVTFTARPGQVTAIVGLSGSGKSTAAALLAGTITGYSGSLTIGAAAAGTGAEISHLDAESLSRAVTLIGAHSHLFAGTLRDNLTMALPAGESTGTEANAVESRLWQALEQARIADFVRSQADGLDMTIEQDAANLSGGQRQRIAIARALLHDAPIVVFDEATSSVDVESEELILATIRELAATHGKTVIMITHRMANAVRADSIVVFDHGETVETGDHIDLLVAGGRYAELFHTQADIESLGTDTDEGAFRPPVTKEPSAELTGGEIVGEAELAEAVRTEPAANIPPSYDGEGVAKRRKERAHRIEEHKAASGTAHSADGAGVDADATAAATADATSTVATRQSDFRILKPRPTAPAESMTTQQVIARLLNEAKPLAGLMTAASVTGAIGHLSATFLPVFGMIAAFALAGHPVWGMDVKPAVIAMIVCALLRGIMRYVEQYLNHNVAFHLLALFRSKAFAALRRLAPAKLAGHGKGDLIALITTDVELLEIFFAHTISPVAIAVVTSVSYTIALLTLDPAMALLLIVAHLIIGVLVPKFFATGVRNLGPAIRRQASALDDVMLDDMRGLDEIIRFGRGEDRVAAIVARTKRLWRKHADLSRVNGRFAAIGGLLVLILTTAAVLRAAFGAASAADLAQVPSIIVAFVLFASSFGPTMALSALPANLTQTFASARRLFALMDESPAVRESGKHTPDYEGMRLDHVTFAYPSSARGGRDGSASVAGTTDDRTDDRAGAPVLDDFTLDIPITGILGIQGPSGRGKSTTLKLLMRYWDPQSGKVTMSGTPLPQVNAHHRRRVQALMGQETHLFDGTIRDNLLLALPQEALPREELSGSSPRSANGAGDAGSEGARAAVDGSAGSRSGDVPVRAGDESPFATTVTGTNNTGGVSVRPGDELLRDACRKASVLDLIDSLPKGLDTPVGELGDRLSEGERQRIGLARVFLRDADLVLFDEPTSRLDALNEAVILRSIRDLARGKVTSSPQTTPSATAVSGAAAVSDTRAPLAAESSVKTPRAKAVVLVSHRESAMRIADQTLSLR
ncbi:ATP-binding cassette domain-containing protein [Bifidobacterium callitrichos]|uniref:ABC transporter ATP-binding protein n=1 Tax=Bifidobacterium callitrichos DSM 23973 TaxID=1437609 RepID=A0A087A798_9BIFI|nr:ATP-binding cassette domain-containing protein [Bifidobacterium callitrichos]KFI54648.1 ABC transporter ATP-binding protein [Bifidobacterium callitrichos DSM 23973]